MFTDMTTTTPHSRRVPPAEAALTGPENPGMRGRRPSPVEPHPVAEQLLLFASISALVYHHREKLTAGVPGCTCGRTYPEGSHAFFPLLHSRHVAEEVISHILAATTRQDGTPRHDGAGQDSVPATNSPGGNVPTAKEAHG